MFVAGTVAAAHVVVVDERVSIFVGWRRVLVIAVIALVSVTGCAQVSSSRPGSVAVAAPATSATNQAPAPAPAPAPASPNTAPGATLVGSGIHVVGARGHVVDDENLTAGQCHARVVDAGSGKFLPDPVCSPGAVDPGVTQANLAQTICRSGFSSLVRAPASETDKAKKLSLQQYGETTSSTTEYDHLISLEVGGTNATSNLWPEPNATNATGVNNPKDPVENQLHTAICSGKISLVDAQKAIATNWTTALNAIH
jgi:hypothetical protein